MTAQADAIRARLWDALDAICQDSLEAPLAKVLTWPSDGQITVLFQTAAAALDALLAALKAETERADEWRDSVSYAKDAIGDLADERDRLAARCRDLEAARDEWRRRHGVVQAARRKEQSERYPGDQAEEAPPETTQADALAARCRDLEAALQDFYEGKRSVQGSPRAGCCCRTADADRTG